MLPEGFDEKAFHAKVEALDEEGSPEVFKTPFEDAALPRPALTAPLTEFVSVLVLMMLRGHSLSIQGYSRRRAVVRGKTWQREVH